jgi:Protein of unknown function (DUF2868)
LFEDSVDVPLWLEADRDTPYAERARRDREIAGRLDSRDRVAQVRGWWRVIGPGSESRAGARLGRLRGLVGLVMIALGALAGTSLALAAFQYDGSQPVNVVRLLALLVGLQLLLLLLTLLLLIPGRMPGFRGVQELLATFNPGSWAGSVYARLARTGITLNPFGRHSRAGAARFAKWQMLVWSQIAAVAFNIAALATAVALVTFTDLAFGWSTTLTVDSGLVTHVVHGIAWPWRGFVPAGVPDAGLVEQSQFFRLDEGTGRATIGDSRVLTGWWPFTLCAIVFYGLLPRVVLLVIAGVRLRSATRDLLLGNPQVAALIDRMRSPEIQTEADRPDERPPSGGVSAGTLDHALGTRTDAIIWEGALGSEGARAEARRRFGTEVDKVYEAGGAQGLENDRKTLDSLDLRGDAALLVFTPAWEPPVLEFLDFLKAVRNRIGGEVSIVVVPVPEDDRATTEVELGTWKHGVGRLEDPRLYVEAGSV